MPEPIQGEALTSKPPFVSSSPPGVGEGLGVAVGVEVGVDVSDAVGVEVGVAVGVFVGEFVGVGEGAPPQPGSLKDPIRVRQLNELVVW